MDCLKFRDFDEIYLSNLAILLTLWHSFPICRRILNEFKKLKKKKKKKHK